VIHNPPVKASPRVVLKAIQQKKDNRSIWIAALIVFRSSELKKVVTKVKRNLQRSHREKGKKQKINNRKERRRRRKNTNQGQ